MTRLRSLAPRLSLFALLAGIAFGAVGCAHVVLDKHRLVNLPDPNLIVRIEYEGRNEWDARLVAHALPKAVGTAAQWADFHHPLTIAIYPTHEALENATGRDGYDWLRAWATYDTIHLQAPSTWSVVHTESHLRELLAHELTHTAMYQTIGGPGDWHTKPIPLWFREGLASVAAGQAEQRLSRAALTAYFTGPAYAGDPIAEGQAIVAAHPKPVYSAGHWMVTDLVAVHGQASLRRLLRRIGRGGTFREAWRDEFGEYLTAWEESWRNSLLSTGAAGGVAEDAAPAP
ncbi:MAG: hypothetical protein C4523_06735 [Myxococcales bacterium]|nr:MAG: hypothetical protein C4523_06735 [Myxococcales bacterium]